MGDYIRNAVGAKFNVSIIIQTISCAHPSTYKIYWKFVEINVFMNNNIIQCENPKIRIVKNQDDPQ